MLIQQNRGLCNTTGDAFPCKPGSSNDKAKIFHSMVCEPYKKVILTRTSSIRTTREVLTDVYVGCQPLQSHNLTSRERLSFSPLCACLCVRVKVSLSEENGLGVYPNCRENVLLACSKIGLPYTKEV